KSFTSTEGYKKSIKRVIYETPITYTTFLIVINFINAISFTTQLIYFFNVQYEIYVQIGALLVNLFLVPSFVKLFITLITSIKNIYAVISKDSTRQPDVFQNMLHNYEFEKNYTRVVFKDYDIKSDRNIFFLDNDNFSKEDRENIKKINLEILETYRELFDSY